MGVLKWNTKGQCVTTTNRLTYIRSCFSPHINLYEDLDLNSHTIYNPPWTTAHGKEELTMQKPTQFAQARFPSSFCKTSLKISVISHPTQSKAMITFLISSLKQIKPQSMIPSAHRHWGGWSLFFVLVCAACSGASANPVCCFQMAFSVPYDFQVYNATAIYLKKEMLTPWWT